MARLARWRDTEMKEIFDREARKRFDDQHLRNRRKVREKKKNGLDQVNMEICKSNNTYYWHKPNDHSNQRAINLRPQHDTEQVADEKRRWAVNHVTLSGKPDKLKARRRSRPWEATKDPIEKALKQVRE